MMMKKMMIMMIAITTKKSSTLLRLGVKIEQGKAETDLVFREENVPSCEALFGRKYQRRERERERAAFGATKRRTMTAQ